VKITTAYEAFWFLHEHPKMRCRHAVMLSPEEAATRKRRKGQRIRKVKDEMPWEKGKTYLLLEMPGLDSLAIECNLDIFYAKVDQTGLVDDDKKKNVFTECWLEFGPVRQVVSAGGKLHLEHSHDPRLDTGGATFDQALVKLARLVKRHYGDVKIPWLPAG
jgi:hypothetical protein